jgi:hypothetical protein
MKHSIPFPNSGGDWRFDVRTGCLVDASAAPSAAPQEQASAPEPAPLPAAGVLPAANQRKRNARKS